MSKVLNFLLVVQLLLIFGFHWFGWNSDQAMGKAGLGDYEEWKRLNDLAEFALHSAGIFWLAAVILAIAGRTVCSTQARLAIGLPPLILICGWVILIVWL